MDAYEFILKWSNKDNIEEMEKDIDEVKRIAIERHEDFRFMDNKFKI